MGKIANQPVYRLLGGTKSRVRAYLAPSLKPDEEIVEECKQAVADGATAIKLRFNPDPRRACGWCGGCARRSATGSS